MPLRSYFSLLMPAFCLPQPAGNAEPTGVTAGVCGLIYCPRQQSYVLKVQVAVNAASSARRSCLCPAAQRQMHTCEFLGNGREQRRCYAILFLCLFGDLDFIDLACRGTLGSRWRVVRFNQVRLAIVFTFLSLGLLMSSLLFETLLLSRICLTNQVFHRLCQNYPPSFPTLNSRSHLGDLWVIGLVVKGRSLNFRLS